MQHIYVDADFVVQPPQKRMSSPVFSWLSCFASVHDRTSLRVVCPERGGRSNICVSIAKTHARRVRTETKLVFFQVVWILHSIFPAYMNGCRSLGSHLYVDVDQQTRDMLLALRAGHQVLKMEGQPPVVVFFVRTCLVSLL